MPMPGTPRMALGAAVVALAGCSTVGGTGGGEGGLDVGGGADAGCQGLLGAPRDPSTLPACCQDLGGIAHCMDNVPAEFSQYTTACTGGGRCVPDPFIETGGVYAPPPCHSLSGAVGVCLSVCIPQIAAYVSILPRDVCGEGEVCAPCVSPLDNMSTGACDIAGECVGGGGPDTPPPPPACDDPTTCEYEASCPPVVNPASLTACGNDAHCLDAALVPMEVRDQLGPCTGAAGKLCVPDVFLVSGGAFTPATCRSLADAEGRCLSRVLPEVKAQESFLPQSSCTTDQRCVPCYNPIDGVDTGACAIGCDGGPAEPPPQLAACCDGRARCVPAEAIPMSMQESLDDDDCGSATPEEDLCVPSELLDPAYVPPPCMASGLILGDYTGVCLSDCLDFGFQGLFLRRGDCADGNKCAPCVNPLDGQPTGAPGCPTM